MYVAVVAQTVINRGEMIDVGYKPHVVEGNLVGSADELAEFAGRTCYQSFARPNAATAANADYLANILTQQHFSVLEHASVTFYIEDVSRSLTHELIRHRHLSYSQLSQRYVDASQMTYVVPPALADDGDAIEDLDNAFQFALADYRDLVESLEAKGSTRKQAREAARCVLPNMTSTALVVTGNLRAWRDVILKRNSPGADAEIQELAATILGHLRIIAPNTVQDLED